MAKNTIINTRNSAAPPKKIVAPASKSLGALDAKANQAKYLQGLVNGGGGKAVWAKQQMAKLGQKAVIEPYKNVLKPAKPVVSRYGATTLATKNVNGQPIESHTVTNPVKITNPRVGAKPQKEKPLKFNSNIKPY